MLRVLQVVTSLNCGGIENLLMNIYRLIDRDKIQFDFLTHRNIKFYFEDEVNRMGGKIYRLPPVNPLPGSYYRKEIDKFFREHNEYKIVHAHMNALSIYVLRAAKMNNVPVRIAHSHSNGFERNLVKKIIKHLSRRNIKKYCNYKFACSKEAGHFLFGNIHDNEYVIIRNGINVDNYKLNFQIRRRLREELNVKCNSVYGHVGSFREAKNHVFLLDVFNEIKKRDDKAKLILIGDGPLSGSIKKKINILNLEDDVIMLGTRDDVNELLMAMDVFLFPSKYEGLGIALIEAQASGLKCLASSNVPIEADVTGLVDFLPIDCTKVWVENAINVENQRVDQSAKIKAAGYDIEYTANWLQKFYINALSKFDRNNLI